MNETKIMEQKFLIFIACVKERIVNHASLFNHLHRITD